MILHLKRWAADALGHAVDVKCRDASCWEPGDENRLLNNQLLAMMERRCMSRGEWCEGRLRISKALAAYAADELENRLDIATGNIAYCRREAARLGDADGSWRRQSNSYRNQAADIRHALSQLTQTEKSNEQIP